MAIDKKARERCEERVYKMMDILDPSGTNTEYYKKLFAKLSDNQFYQLMKKEFPYKFHVTPMVTEPTVDMCETALSTVTGYHLMEEYVIPYFYKNSEGVPLGSTEKGYSIYIHFPKVQQMIVKKNKYSINIDNRDMKTGRLASDDKGTASTDREIEALVSLGYDACAKEFSTFRADSMDSKNVAYNTISNKGVLSASEIPDDPDDSLSRNLMNVYMIGACINSNMINQGNYTRYTLDHKESVISRDDE